MKFKVMHGYEEQERHDRAYHRALTPAERLNMVEELRLSAGKFIYEYPARLRRVFVPVKNAPR